MNLELRIVKELWELFLEVRILMELRVEALGLAGAGRGDRFESSRPMIAVF